MAENGAPKGKAGGFLNKEVAGLPNWAWLLIIAAGVAAAYIVPKFLGGGSKGPSASTGTGADTTGLGLAIDPVTGLPYAVEGLVPSGSFAGQPGQLPPLPIPTPTPTPTPPPVKIPTIFRPPKRIMKPPHIEVHPPEIGTIWTIGGKWVTRGGTQGVPLVPYAQSVPGTTGSIFSYNGQQYTVVAGPGGRIWGVPGRMSAQQAANTADKVLLHAPSSYYGMATNQSHYRQTPAWPYMAPSEGELSYMTGITPTRLRQLNVLPAEVFNQKGIRTA